MSEDWLSEYKQDAVTEATVIPFTAVVAEQQKKNVVKKKSEYESVFFTDDKLAKEFVKTFAGEVRSVIEWQAWATYDAATGTWVKQHDDGSVALRAKDWIDDLYTEVSEKGTFEDKKKLEKYFNIGARKAVVASSFEEVRTSSSVFDAKSDHLLVGNGVLDLRSGDLEEVSPDHCFTKHTSVRYASDAASETWQQILSAFPEDCHEYLQMIVGQALTGYQPSDASIFFFHGGGKNGKSTFLNVVKRIAGSNAENPSPSVLLVSDSSSSNELMVFKGLRLAIFEELPNNRFLNAQVIKRLSGTEELRARELYQREEQFKVIVTNFIATNHLPSVSEQEDGTWRRLKVIPAPYRFKPANQCDGPNDRPEIANLKNLCETPEVLEAALAWAVEGAMKWFAADRVEPALPKSVRVAVEEWRGANDKIGSWLSESVRKTPSRRDKRTFCLMDDLYDSYVQWVKESGRSAESKPNFMNALKDHPLLSKMNASFHQKSRHKELEQSKWFDPLKGRAYRREGDQYFMREAASQATYVAGIEFIGA